MCRYYDRICRIESQLAAQEVAVRKNEEIAGLKDIIFELKAQMYSDRGDAGCVRGETLLRTSKLAETFCDRDRVVGSHPPVIVERHEEHCEKHC